MTRETFIETYSQVAEIQREAVLNGTRWFDLVLRTFEHGTLAILISVFRTDNDDDYASFSIYESTDKATAFRIINNLKAFVCL